MDFHEDLARIATDPEMLRSAVRRAGSRELAEDAMQETARAIAERKGAQAIDNLPGYFYRAMIHEIDHQLGRSAAIPDVDIGLTSDRHQSRLPLTASQAPLVDVQAYLRSLGDEMLAALERKHARNGLASLIPGRSEDPVLYRSAIARAAKVIFGLLLEGYVTAADWNAILKAAYPQWFDEPGLARAAMDQRLSRARRDLQSLLRSVLSRDQVAS